MDQFAAARIHVWHSRCRDIEDRQGAPGKCAFSCARASLISRATQPARLKTLVFFRTSYDACKRCWYRRVAFGQGWLCPCTKMGQEKLEGLGPRIGGSLPECDQAAQILVRGPVVDERGTQRSGCGVLFHGVLQNRITTTTHRTQKHTHMEGKENMQRGVWRRRDIFVFVRELSQPPLAGMCGKTAEIALRRFFW